LVTPEVQQLDYTNQFCFFGEARLPVQTNIAKQKRSPAVER